MRSSLCILALLLTASAEAQTVDGARSIIERTYNLTPPVKADDPLVGDLLRTTYETYGLDGRRLRSEWRDPDGAVTLTMIELYDDSDRPFGAVSFGRADLDPSLERNEYRAGDSPGTTVKRVTKFGADGKTTSVEEFVLDASGRDLEGRYEDAENAFSGSETSTYDGPNVVRFVWVAGPRRGEFVYRVQTVDGRGHWTSRTVERDGEPSQFVTREIEYADE